MSKFFKKCSLSSSGQAAIEYALAIVVMAAVASWLFIFYQGLSEKTMYGGASPNMGIEQTVALPFP